MYFLNINKPKGITSFDVIRKLRKKLNIRQIGHSGTLDPLAWGVMQVGVGSATKLLDFLPSDKEYIAEIKFGFETTTYDEEGEKFFIKKPDFTFDELNIALKSFLGKTMQIPPKYSAIKSGGKKLCDMARNNAVIDLSDYIRPIEIYSIDILKFNGYDELQLKISCKKGAYIRSFVFDLGRKLSCGAYLVNLERTKAGNFSIEFSNNLDDEEYNYINPLNVLSFPKYELNELEFQKILNGNFINTDIKFNDDKILLTKNNKLVSIAVLSDNLIKPKKLFKDNL